MIRIAVTSLFLVACVQPAVVPLTPQVHPGPAARAPVGRVLVLEPTCGSAEFRCPKNYIETVDNIVRASLEFNGYAVVGPDRLRLQTRQRNETKEITETHSTDKQTSTADSFGPNETGTTHKESSSIVEKTTIVLDGPGFEDLTVLERDEVLAQAGADSIVVVRIVVGAATQGWSAEKNQNVDVMVRLAVNRGDTLAWASRCLAGSNTHSSVTGALEEAARCAVFGGTGQ